MLGSFAYNAPEMTNSGIASPKSDVFSLGVILLELLTGKRPVDTSQPKRQQSLLTWVSAPGVNTRHRRRSRVQRREVISGHCNNKSHMLHWQSGPT